MNILIIAPNFYPENSGFANAFTNFALELAKHGKVKSVSVFTFAGHNAGETKVDNVEVIRARALAMPLVGRLLSFFLWTRTVNSLLKDKRIDTVLYETGINAVFGLLVLRLIARNHPHVTFMVRVHAIADTERIWFPKSAMARIHAYFTRKLYEACTTITATNSYHIDFVKRNFLRGDPFVIGKKTFFVVPNVVHIPNREAAAPELHEYRELFERMQGKKVLVSLGGMSRGGDHGQGKFVQKGYVDLLYAISLIEDKRCLDDALFVVVGRGAHQQYFKGEIQRLGLDKYFVVIEYLPNEAVHSILQQVRATVLVSRVEGLSMFALEALANGSPLLVTRTGGLVDLIEEGENGYVAEVQDIEGISKKIALLLSLGEKEIQGMRDCSKEIFRDRFSSERTIERFVKFAELLASRRT